MRCGYSCRSARRRPAPSQDFSKRRAAVQHTRAHACSPVQQLINSSASSSSVTARSQGHLHRHAAAFEAGGPTFFRGDVWGSPWFCMGDRDATPGLERACANAGPRTCSANYDDGTYSFVPLSFAHSCIWETMRYTGRIAQMVYYY